MVQLAAFIQTHNLFHFKHNFIFLYITGETVANQFPYGANGRIFTFLLGAVYLSRIRLFRFIFFLFKPFQKIELEPKWGLFTDGMNHEIGGDNK